MPQNMTQSPPSALSLAWLFGTIALAALSRALSYPFRTISAPTLRKDVLYTIIRTMLEHITIPQTRYLNASTTESYLKFCKAQKQEPRTLQVPGRDSTATAHWIGDPNAETVILYFHGGGYIQSATSGSFLYLQHVVNTLNRERDSRSVAGLVLAYSLAPEAIHPTQLREATSILSHLVESTGRSPSDIFISGDSAGGNLALGLLSHLLHPHPQVAPITLQKPLAGTLLYSPGVTYNTDFPSFEKNASLDMIIPSKIRIYGAMQLGKCDPQNPDADPGHLTGDVYTEPYINEPSWWQGMHRITESIMVLSGGDEVFIDPIREFQKNLWSGWIDGGGSLGDVVIIVTPREAHVGPIVDFMISGNGGRKSTAQVAAESWYKGRLYNQ